jgi:hypothetical protein
MGQEAIVCMCKGVIYDLEQELVVYMGADLSVDIG